MIVYVVCVYLLFFKQKTAYEMRISDWSSDVCSSDLRLLARNIRAGEADRDTRRHVVIQAEVEPPRGADAVEAHGDRNRSEREAVGDVAVEILGAIGVDRPRRGAVFFIDQADVVIIFCDAEQRKTLEPVAGGGRKGVG